MATDPNRISTQASNFLKAALRCGEQRKIDKNQIEWLMIPENVCLAFSIELNLKALIYHEGHNPPEIHNLEKLFKQLNGKTQNDIIKELEIDKKIFLKAQVPDSN